MKYRQTEKDIENILMMNFINELTLGQPGDISRYEIMIDLQSVKDANNEDSCVEDFNECIDTFMDEYFKSSLGCVPPYLSSRNHCKDI